LRWKWGVVLRQAQDDKREVRYTILEVRSLQFTVYRLQLAVGMQEEVGRWKYDIRN